MPFSKILLIDDDVELCSLMADFFLENGISVHLAHDGPTGLAQALSARFDLILLDVMLPVMDGFEVLKRLRETSSISVIMLTARTEERDRVSGLNGGADDYLSKPFGPQELLARVRAVLRRSIPPADLPQALKCGAISLNNSKREVRRGDYVLPLTFIEFEILHLLMRSEGKIVSRDEISTALYQRQATPYERALDVHISHLRTKLACDKQSTIHTVRGVGYMLSRDEPGCS